MAATSDEVDQLLRNLFNGGRVERVPKNRKDAEVFLALAAAFLDPQAVMSERELNDLLSEWLSGVADQSLLDHVTLRRYLVDHALLFRDPDGNRYRANQAVSSGYIEAPARMLRPADVFDQIQAERAERRARRS